MFQPLALLWGLLIISSAQATPNGQAILNIGPEVLNKVFSQELTNQDAIQVLKELPLYEAMRNDNSIPLIGGLISGFLKQIVWLKVTEVSMPQLAFQLSEESHPQVKIPLDMVAGLNTIITKKLIELHVEVDIIAELHTETDNQGNSYLVLRKCTNSPNNLSISLLQKLSFAVRFLANKVIDVLMPALPTLVRREVCPVIEKAFKSMTSKIYAWSTSSVSIGSNSLSFKVLSSSAVDSNFELDLNAKLQDSAGNLVKVFDDSWSSLTVPNLDDFGFSFIVKQDVVNAAIGALLPIEELTVLLDSVLPELARELKSVLNKINTKASIQLGPTQIVKIFTQQPPDIVLKDGSARVAQLIVFEVFATNTATRPLFTLGIEASSEGQFYTERNRLFFNLNGISSERIYLMNSGTGLFSPDLMGTVISEILLAVLLPNQNGLLRNGIFLSIFKNFGYNETKVFPIELFGEAQTLRMNGTLTKQEGMKANGNTMLST
ncbi:BPI fold-containing family B member 1 [Trichosurus vulpecula]|uniref:BPI fold-containing family B member 1 n=1 Tax=Trichosurus vulpecula TaxID=9337 RepID=UPI00186AF74A|nr:BPI fold-containing family B member 1 [Trichosurus vulpecula]